MKKIILTLSIIFGITAASFAGTLERTATVYMKNHGFHEAKVTRASNSMLTFELQPFNKCIRIERPDFSRFNRDNKYWIKLGDFGRIKTMIDGSGKEYKTVFLKQKKMNFSNI